MQFHSVAIDHAIGKILGHNIARRNGTRLMRKGKPLTEANVALLRNEARASVYVAELEPGDVGEDEAARKIAGMIMGRGLRSMGAAGGRVNLLSTCLGLLRVDASLIEAINEVADGAVTVASLANYSVTTPKQMAVTIKVIPYAVPGAALDTVRTICGMRQVVRVDEFAKQKVTMILGGSAGARERLVADFGDSVRARIEACGSILHAIEFVPQETEEDETALSHALRSCRERGDAMVILAGDTAIMDRHDLAPRAIERAGGDVTIFGAPVDPGNLLLVAYLGHMPILGAPGCVRSRKLNVVDYVLPRLLSGDRLTRRDVVGLGVGGLLEEIHERGMIRET